MNQLSTKATSKRGLTYIEIAIEWPKYLPPADTLVGRFRLPIGYIADPTILNSE